MRSQREARKLIQAGRDKAGQGQLDDAMDCFVRATEVAPGYFEGWLVVGAMHMRDQQWREAVAALRRAHQLQPERMDTTRAFADALFQTNASEEALPLWQAVVAAQPDDIAASMRLGETRNRLGLHEDELKTYQQALQHAPKSADLWMSLAEAQEDSGRRDEAVQAYARALEIERDWPVALAGLLTLQGADVSAERVARAEQLLARPDLDDRNQALLGYALGKVHDARDDAHAAMATWHDANAARRRFAGNYDREQVEQSVQRLMDTFDTAFFQRADLPTGSDDSRPVFVVGMPRSGTTLTERILASHPQAHGCGELPDTAEFLRGMGQQWPENVVALNPGMLERQAADYLGSATRNGSIDALRLVDKAPLNYYNLGLLAMLFPKAHVVWCRRDPRDVAISIYGANFSPDARFATDLSAIAHTAAMEARLMAHWQAVLPLPVHEQRYEKLVTEPEDQVRQLLTAVGLPWDAACLDFHRSSQPVQTPSRWQVRQPIHTRSVGRWQAYASYLEDFPS